MTADGLARINWSALAGVPAEMARRRSAKLRASPAAFRDHLLIDNNGRFELLGDVMAPFQRADFAAQDAAWCKIAGAPPPAGVDPAADIVQQFYAERPRGHSKTTDQACSVLWAIWASVKKLNGFAVAASKEQAGFLANAVDTLIRANPWIGETVDRNKWVISNRRTGSTCKILSSDSATSYGATPDFVIVDELTHWKKQDLWTATFSGTAKRANCLLAVIANAGYGQGTSWQWSVREGARTDPENWYFNTLPGPVAPWITPKKLAQQRRSMPPTEYRRLWENLWIEGGMSALNLDDFRACITLRHWPTANLWVPAVAGIDLALTHDHAALVILGIDVHRGKLPLLFAKAWDPKHFPDNKISLKTVEAEALQAFAHYNVAGCAYDPWQAERIAEEFRSNGVKTFSYPFTPSNCNEMALRLMEAGRNRDLEMADCPPLMRDLARMVVTERTLGYKLEAPKDENGHCDVGTALAIALPWAYGTLNDYRRDAA